MINSPEEKKEMLDIRLNHPCPDVEPVDMPEESADYAGAEEFAHIPDAGFSEEKKGDSLAAADTKEDTVTEETPAHSLPRRIVDRVLYSLGGFIPKRGDPVLEVIRKCVFFVALITLITSLSYIIDDMVIIPVRNQIAYNQIGDEYDPSNPAPPPADFPESEYPAGISDSFKALYAQNQDIRGWLKYTDTNGSWLDINYPVMFSGNNSYYLSHDFQKDQNKNGALFFDQRTNLESAKATNKVLIIYGHNMASGQMFAPLNKFLGNISYIRSAPTISLDTLYEREKYQVFAVMVLNVDTKDGPYFDYLRTSFSSDTDFVNFVANIRARSIYDFKNVNVTSNDQLLILSTCTAESGAHFDNGRCVVVARRVKDGESVNTNSSSIVKNDDAIYPLAWYKNQNLPVHKFYTDTSYVIPGLQTVASVVSPVPITTSPGAGSTTAGTSVRTTSGTTAGKTGKTTASQAAPPTKAPSKAPTQAPTEASKPTDKTTEPPTTVPTTPETTTTDAVSEPPVG